VNQIGQEDTLEPQRQPPTPTAFTSVVVGFDVVDRDGEKLGPVTMVNLARTCVIVKTGRSLLGRKVDRPVHISSVTGIDVDRFTINVAATRKQIADAPELLGDKAEAEVESYYVGLVEP